MTLFWHGHFATATGKVMISQAIYQQNETLRRLALGNFPTLLARRHPRPGDDDVPRPRGERQSQAQRELRPRIL